MPRGPLTYLSLIIRTAFRHSLDVTQSVIFILILLAWLVTYFFPRVVVTVDLNSGQVAAALIGVIVFVRLLFAPYWIWRDGQGRLAALNDKLANEAQVAARLATKNAAIDDVANEIAWAVNNLVNPKPWPLSTDDPESAIAAFSAKLDAWCSKVSKKLENREVFTQGDQVHFDDLGLFPTIQHTGHVRLDYLFSQLKLKIERLREIEHRARERI